MSAFFANMNLARAIILMSIAGSAFLAWAGWAGFSLFGHGWSGYRELQEMRLALQQQVPDTVRDIQELAEVHTKLTRDKDGDQFVLKQAKPELYIRSIADQPSIQLGQLTLDPDTGHPSKGIVDQKYRIVPEKRDRAYSRGQIAQFLWELEAKSRRVKVTGAKIDLLDSKTKPHEIPRDAWTFEAEVTSRQKEGD